MSGARIRNGTHPSLEALALYAGGDLRGPASWRMRMHLRRCERCRDEITRFRAAKAELKRASEQDALAALGAVSDWKRLEREMTGNIAVGLAAARCIECVGRKRVIASRGVVAAIGLVALFVAGWLTHIPAEQNRHLLASLESIILGKKRPAQPAATIVETMPDGIAVRTPAASLIILHPPSAVVSLGGNSGVAASYIDQETGQVTIANVYAQ